MIISNVLFQVCDVINNTICGPGCSIKSVGMSSNPATKRKDDTFINDIRAGYGRF